MPFDAHKNLALSTVATAPSPATSGTTLVVAAGEGARFPAVPFNATVWPNAAVPSPANAEIVRVTAIAGDSLTLTRAQESTTARAIVVGDVIAATITVKTLTDIEAGTNFPLITTPGAGTFGGDILFPNHAIVRQDTNATLTGMGHGVGGNVRLFGDTYPGGVQAGKCQIMMGSAPTASIDFLSGAGSFVRQKIHASGGVSFGDAVDPGANTVRVTGDVSLSAANASVRAATDTQRLNIGSGFTGGYVSLFGNADPVSQGKLLFNVTHASAGIEFGVAVGLRQKIHASGGISFGSASDPGPGVISFTGELRQGTFAYGQSYISFRIVSGSGILETGTTSAASALHQLFSNPNGNVGSIATNGTTTAYNTTSDARLKQDRGIRTDPEVLRHTVIHDFHWIVDGTPGRGVFAQEAAAVAPFAVTEGTDERDETGLLKHPWGVDYAKYVPDLIVGWQHHEQQIATLTATVETLTEKVQMLEQRFSDLHARVLALISTPPSPDKD